MSLTRWKKTTAKERRIFRIRQPHTKEITKKEKRRRDSNKVSQRCAKAERRRTPFGVR